VRGKKLDKNDIYAVFDSQRMKQILLNLTTNALKYTLEGTVEIGCYIENEILYFYVKDTGIGIPKEQQSLIFEPFRQVENSTSAQTGTGLGLAICKGFLKIMNGQITLHSTEGKGSEFIVSIPYKKTIQENIIQETISNNNFNWTNKNILIVEDDEYAVELLKEILTPTGVKIHIANSIYDALQIFEKQKKINLILMDIGLPDGNGLELTSKIKTLYPDTIIIAQTANAMNNDKKNCIAAGCDDYVSKPINPGEVLELINHFFII
jgi:CheY-like chemotaxis protein